MATKVQGKSKKEVLSKKLKLTLYRNLVRAGHYDKCMIRRIQSGQLVGFYHASEGGTAPGVGVCSLLTKDDVLWAHHRGHGVQHMLSKGIDVKTFLAEHSGKQTGCCKGRSSYHWSYPDHGVFGFSGFIGAGYSPSVGWGLACKKNGKGQVTVHCGGDGGAGRGALHEAFLLSSNWKLPIVWVVENNSLSIFGKTGDMHPTENLADLAKGFDMPAVVVDGQDVIACAEAATVAIEHARSGKGPYMIEAKTTRFQSHAVGVPDLADFSPREAEDLAELRKRDPIVICRERLLKEKILTKKLIDQIDQEATEEVAEAERFADESPVADYLDMNNIDALVYAD